MKVFIKWIIVTIVLSGIVLLMLNTNAFISKQNWKYRDGFHIGDWVKFDTKDMYIKGNTIIKNGQVVADIKICVGKMLVISDSKTGVAGYYINK